MVLINISYDKNITELFNQIKKIENLNKLKLKKYGFNNIGVSILTIMMTEENITQRQIVNRINVPKQTINYTIKDLFNQGLITIEPDKKDKRSKVLNLSKDGEIFLSEILSPITSINHEIASDLGDDRVERLIDDLKFLADSVEEKIKRDDV